MSAHFLEYLILHFTSHLRTLKQNRLLHAMRTNVLYLDVQENIYRKLMKIDYMSAGDVVGCEDLSMDMSLEA